MKKKQKTKKCSSNLSLLKCFIHGLYERSLKDHMIWYSKDQGKKTEISSFLLFILFWSMQNLSTF